MKVIYVSVLVACLIGFSDAFYCWECSSKHGNCSQDSLHGAIKVHCGNGYDYCAVYRTILSDETPGVFTRACTTSCNMPHVTWVTKTNNTRVKHCLKCCNSEYQCNGLLGDPCSDTNKVQDSFQIVFGCLLLLWNLIG
ncbi:uncharacterized protein LOC116304169 isoform X1 [Actinia tenebrosa]|uniref:Uncharacterized protein LOC116304169 isoform X1 n=1 Tax=Actinia tenebrosa TaxID=6105 RepID=A0A6P8IU49_ACTTE|nr:uncharacterized protein LOC116304169 isoform X1 [Actinia tenebrosa]